MADRAAGLPESVSDVEEDISESWEEIDEEELERRVESRQKQLAKEEAKTEQQQQITAKTTTSSSDSGGGTSTFSPMQGPTRIKLSEGSEYVAQIKILKRPETQSSQHRSHGTEQPKTYKSLAEREAEYANARARILGPAYSGDQLMSLQQKSSPSNESKLLVRQPRAPSQGKGFSRTQHNKS